MTPTRSLHPLAWWIWSAGIAIAIARANSLLLSCGVVGVVAIVVKVKSASVPWAKSFRWSLHMGLWIVAIRISIGVLISVPSFGRTLITLPTIALPTWMAGIRIGGPVTWERLTATAHEGITLAAILALLGAAASVASPHQLLRALPIMIYEFGVAIVIATSVLPHIVANSARIRQAQYLRGQNVRGVESWRRLAVPLLEDSLSRSLELAAAMDSRGYGFSRRRSRYRPSRWRSNDFLLASLAILAAIYPLLSLVAAPMALALAPRQAE